MTPVLLIALSSGIAANAILVAAWIVLRRLPAWKRRQVADACIVAVGLLWVVMG